MFGPECCWVGWGLRGWYFGARCCRGPKLCVQVPNCRKRKLCCQSQISFLCGRVCLSVQRLLWNYLIFLPAIDRYRRSDGAVASISTSTSICIEPIWDFGEGGACLYCTASASVHILWAFAILSGLLTIQFWFKERLSEVSWIMGAFCSCLQPDYSDHHGNQTSSAFRNCMCLRCFTQQLINAVCSPYHGCLILY